MFKQLEFYGLRKAQTLFISQEQRFQKYHFITIQHYIIIVYGGLNKIVPPWLLC